MVEFERRESDRRGTDDINSIKSRIERIENDIRSMNDRIDDHFVQEASMHSRMAIMEHDLLDIKTDIKELLEMYKQGVGVAKFVKWLAPFAVGVWALSQWLKDHIRF